MRWKKEGSLGRQRAQPSQAGLFVEFLQQLH